MIFFEGIIYVPTKEEAEAKATARFWRDMRIECMGRRALRVQYEIKDPKRLPDNIYIDCRPIYEYQLRIYACQLKDAWEEILTTMKSFHEMRAAFARLGVVQTRTKKK